MTAGGRLTRLAEADAGLPDEESAARILAAEGPGAGQILGALAATRTELAGLPPERMPTAVAAALAAGFDAIDREVTEPHPDGHDAPALGPRGLAPGSGSEARPGRDPAVRAREPAPDRGRRGRRGVRRVPSGGRRRRRGLVLTAAAAALVGVVLTGPAPPSPPTDLASATGRVLAERTRQVGALSDPSQLASCLLRAGAPGPAGPVLAGRPIRLDGTEGVLLVIATGTRGVVRAVVPTPDCTRILADLVVGG